jgi:diguanylate cyclase (GGDEF)-like protein
VIPLAGSEVDGDADHGIWLVFEHRGGRGTSLERRVIAAAGQAGAVAALALSRATLFQQQRAVAMTDALTGLPNRRSFDELTDGLDRGPLGQRTEYAIILVDIDHFKQVNDTHGHQTGDEVLAATARALAASAPPEATVARYGGEEFVVVLPGVRLGDAVAAAERMRRGVSAMDSPLAVTASFGVALAAGRVASAAVAAADAALYRAKETGRDRVVAEEPSPPGEPLAPTRPVPRQAVPTPNPRDRTGSRGS